MIVMRFAWVVVALVLVAGCSQPPESLHAGGKSIEYWLQRAHDRDARVRKDAIHMLGNVGTEDPAARPAVIAALKDSDAAVRSQVVQALARALDDPEAVQALREATKDKDAKVRDYANRALKQL
jgi:HEAT repeats